MANVLDLKQGNPKFLKFADVVNEDLRLLEVDEALLKEIVANG